MLLSLSELVVRWFILIIYNVLLLLQLLCLLTFWLLLRQAMTEKKDKQADTQLSTIIINMEG